MANKLSLSGFENPKAANSMFKMDLSKLQKEMDKPYEWCNGFKGFCELKKKCTNEEIEAIRTEYYSNQS